MRWSSLQNRIIEVSYHQSSANRQKFISSIILLLFSILTSDLCLTSLPSHPKSKYSTAYPLQILPIQVHPHRISFLRSLFFVFSSTFYRFLIPICLTLLVNTFFNGIKLPIIIPLSSFTTPFIQISQAIYNHNLLLSLVDKTDYS